MQCDYVNCLQNRNSKCMAPGYRECLKAKDDIYNHTNTDGSVYYVFGKRKAKKAKEQFPNLTVMYRTARTKGLWVEYKSAPPTEKENE